MMVGGKGGGGTKVAESWEAATANEAERELREGGGGGGGMRSLTRVGGSGGGGSMGDGEAGGTCNSSDSR